jgi:hypothetical protein
MGNKGGKGGDGGGGGGGDAGNSGGANPPLARTGSTMNNSQGGGLQKGQSTKGGGGAVKSGGNEVSMVSKQMTELPANLGCTLSFPTLPFKLMHLS